MKDGISIVLGDCLEIMAEIEDNTFDTLISDPPYGLNFMGKDWDKFRENKNPAGGDTGRGKPYARHRVAPAFYHYSAEDKATYQEFSYLWAKEALRIIKPGGTLLAMGGTRTYHRLACGIEDAGWEIKDMISWVHGQGFPKSFNIGLAIDKKFGAEREVIGESNSNVYRDNKNHKFYTQGTGNPKYEKGKITAPSTPEAILWEGWGTALKPALEPIVIAIKPREGTYVENALKWGVAGWWIDGGRISHNEDTERFCHNTANRGSVGDFGINKKEQITRLYREEGRFPANLIHDGSEEVLALFPESGNSSWRGARTDRAYPDALYPQPEVERDARGYKDTGSVARYFYCAKASKTERNLAGDNDHPTLKPLELMRYLVRLTKTPTGGKVIDPFMGSGTTGVACILEGREFLGIEQSEKYFNSAQARLEYYSENEEELKNE